MSSIKKCFEKNSICCQIQDDRHCDCIILYGYKYISMTLKGLRADVEQEFQEGNVVLRESERDFSELEREHNNALVKTDGAAIVITENPSALLKCMTFGPAVCQLVREYDEVSQSKQKIQMRHREDTPSVHKRFQATEVKSLTDCIEDLGNPLTEESGKLLH